MDMLAKRTKIIATIGPASDNPETIRALIEAGANVFRLNFSHSNAEAARATVERIHAARKSARQPVAIMADTKGPEVRIYGYAQKLLLAAGDSLVIESHPPEGIENLVSADPGVVYTNLPEIDTLCAIGQTVLLMDGKISCEVTSRAEGSITVRIGNAAELRQKAHLTIPKVDYPIPFLSDKDIEDITFAVENQVEYIALSFVRSATDVEEVRRLVQRVKTRSGHRTTVKLIAKIESAKGLAAADEIVAAADGIMVARGDLGVEVDIQAVPIAQKKLIRAGSLAAKPVITATQMLESMMESPIPTRAEASDVANACFDSTSAVMLSGETAIGLFPVKVVETMRDIIQAVETEFDYEGFHANMPEHTRSNELAAVVSYSALSIAYEVKASGIIVFTETGHAAQLISRLRPRMPIFAFTRDEGVYNQLAMNWGVCPFLFDGSTGSMEVLVPEVLERCRQENALKKEDIAVIVAGLPLLQKGNTNMIRVETV
ncbi:MAG: pyruvate kinase [Acidobacteria bacterium]|nr:pyruvate kinase [Acidobacteriota bacterium]